MFARAFLDFAGSSALVPSIVGHLCSFCAPVDRGGSRALRGRLRFVGGWKLRSLATLARSPSSATVNASNPRVARVRKYQQPPVAKSGYRLCAYSAA
jgi:hypothetical protein